MDPTTGNQTTTTNAYRNLVTGPVAQRPITAAPQTQATNASFVSPMVRRVGSLATSAPSGQLGTGGQSSGRSQTQVAQAAQAGYLAGLLKALPLLGGAGIGGNRS